MDRDILLACFQREPDAMDFGFTLDHISSGEVHILWPMRTEYCESTGTVQEKVIVSLLGLVARYTALSLLDENETIEELSLEATFLYSAGWDEPLLRGRTSTYSFMEATDQRAVEVEARVVLGPNETCATLKVVFAISFLYSEVADEVLRILNAREQ